MQVLKTIAVAEPSFMIGAYLVYLAISIGMTVWVARTLSHNGRHFLITSFHGNEKLADSINHLLVVGFYLINLGFITLAVRHANEPTDLVALFEFLCSKVGLAMVVLAAAHFFNLYLFNKVRARATLEAAPPPVEPEEIFKPAKEA